MVLETANVADVGEAPEIWERVVTKLSLSAMPPVGVPHPDASFYEGFLGYLEVQLDEAARQNPNPGRPAVHRLNRTEYANAIRELLAVEIDAAALLPPDNIGEGFDNIADVLAVSPLLMERYLFAAGRVSSIAVGPRARAPAAEMYEISDTFRQDQRMNEELPFGSRGGTIIKHRFRLDSDASFYEGFLGYLEVQLDEAARQNPNPGRPAVHRLNRTEYANAIRELLAVEIDAAALLPPDNIGEGFDNIADVLAVSPLLMERYLFAAGRVSSIAVGPRARAPAAEMYEISDTFRQDQRMNEELPFGSSIDTAFPATTEC